MATNRDILFTLKMRNEASATMRAFATDMKAQGKSVGSVAKEIQKLKESFKGTGTVIDNAAGALNRLGAAANSRPLTNVVNAIKNLNTEGRKLNGTSTSLASIAASLRTAGAATKQFQERTRGIGSGLTGIQKLTRDIQALSSGTGNLNAVALGLNRIGQQVRAITVTGAGLSNFARAMTNVSTSIRRVTVVSRNLASTVTLVTNLVRSFNGVENLRRFVTQLAVAIRGLNTVTKDTAHIRAYSTALDDLTKHLKASRIEAERLFRSLERVRRVRPPGPVPPPGAGPNERTNNRSNPITGNQTLGGVVAGTVGAFIGVQTIQAAVTNMAEYDQALANVRAATAVLGETSTQTAERIGGINREVLQFGANSTVGPKALLDVMTELGKAGLDAGNSMSVAKDAIALSQATGYDAADSAKALVVAMASFGLTTAESTRIADIFTNTVNATTADMADLAVGLKYAAPLANALGISINETSAVLGTLAQNGLDASTAGTSFAQMLEQIINPSKKAQEVLKSVGLSMADLDPRKKSLQEIFRLLRDKNIDEGALAAIFGTQGFRPAQILSNTVDKDKGFTEINAGTQNAVGEAERTAADRTNSLMGDFQRLRAAIEGALNYQGQENGILSTLREITQNVTGVIGVMSGLGSATGAQKAKFEEFAATIRTVGQVLAALVAFKGFSILLNTIMSVANGLAFLGGKAKFAYDIINTALKLTGLRALLTTIGAAVSQYGLLGGAARLAGMSATGMGTAAVAAIRAIGVAAAANPFGLILIAIGLVVAALIYFKDETFKWGNETVRVGDVVIALWEQVKAGFDLVGTSIVSAISSVSEWFSTLWENSKTALGGILGSTLDFIKMLLNGWVGYAISVKDVFVTLGTLIVQLIKGMYDNASEMINNITDALYSVATGDFSGASEAMSRKLSTDIGANLVKTLEEAGTKIKSNFDKDYVGSFADAAVTMIKDIKDGTLDSMDSIMQRAAQIGEQNRRAILEARKDADLSPFITKPTVVPVVPPNSNIPSTNDTVGGIGEIPGVGDDDNEKKSQTALANAQKATQEMRDQLKLVGLTGQALEQEKAALDVINDLRSAGVTDEKTILQAVRDRVQAMRDVQAAQQEYNNNPLNGAKSAFQNYYDEAVNYAKGTETAWSNALSNVEDAFVDFAKTGEFSLKTVMNSFFEDMLRASYRSLSAQLLGAMGLAQPNGGAQGATVAGIFSGLLPAANKDTAATVTNNASAAKSTVSQAVAAGFTQAAQTPAVQTAFQPTGAALGGAGNVQQQVWDFFSGKGLQPHQVAGIMGQVQAESGFNPNAVGDGGNATGLFQWNDRGPAMQASMGGNWKNNVQGQLDFAWKEMQTTENASYQKLMAAQNAKQSNDAMIGFERPSGYSPGNVENSHNYTGRLDATYSALDQFGTKAQTAADAVTQLGERGRTAGDQVNVLGQQAQTAKTAVAETPVANGQMDSHVQAYTASLKSTFDQSVAGVQGATQSYTQGLQQNAQQAQTATAQTATTLQNTASSTATAVQPVAPGLGGAFSTLLQGVGGIASSFLGGFGSVLTGIVKLLGSMGSGAGGATGGTGGGLFSGIGSFFSNLFGGAGVAHTGGEIGTAAIAARSVGSGVFRGAQRYHSGLGLKMDEFPTILQKGEYVIPRAEIAAMKKRTNSKSAASNGFGSFLEGGQGPGGSPASRADRIVSPGQGSGGVGGNQTSMTVINNIQSQDANSFRKSESQIGFETARSLNTQLRRTGNQHNG